MLREVLGDISAFGGAPMYGVLTLLVLLMGQYSLFWQLVLAGALIHGIAYLARVFHFVERPDRQKHHNFLERIDASSFPSIHSGRVAALALLFIYFLSGYCGLNYTGCTPVNVFWSGVFLMFMAVVVAGMRVVLRRHYFVDALFGFILGIFAAQLAASIIA